MIDFKQGGVEHFFYGDPYCSEVISIRKFRDSVLKQSALGKRFISFYYTHGPNWAKAIKNKNATKKAIRWLLNQFVRVYKKF